MSKDTDLECIFIYLFRDAQYFSFCLLVNAAMFL